MSGKRTKNNSDEWKKNNYCNSSKNLERKLDFAGEKAKQFQQLSCSVLI
jgi:hypothetical protein